MSGLPVIYISKRCEHCIRLIKILYKKPELKGHYKIISIDDSPFPKTVKSVPCMISDGQIINATDLFNYILSSGNTEQQQQSNSTPNSEQSCSVDELSGFCNNDSCLDFSPINESENIDKYMFSYIDEPSQPQMNHSNNNNDFSSEKRKQFDNDYEKLMSERGEINKPRPFA